MKIAVNTRLLIPGKLEGIGWFTCESLRHMCTSHPEHQFYFIFDRSYDPSFIFSSNITPLVTGPMARHPFLYCLWFGFSLPALLNKIKPDLFLSPDGYLPLRYKGKMINVIHDLNFEHYPGDLPLLERWFYRRYFPLYARRADRIATVSEYSKNDIVSCYHVEESKIDVVYNGVNACFGPLSAGEQHRVRQEYTGGQAYFLFVGSLHPRKNLARLFQAFDLYKTETHSETRLVIAGAKKWWRGTIRKAYETMEHKKDVVFTGRVPAAKLQELTASALAITYLSYFEGFGIPILEAFASHTPLLTSNVTSMPEIAGDAALLCDPFSVRSIADHMKKISLDEELRARLVAKGTERLLQFSWEATASRLWQSMMNAMQSPDNIQCT